MPEVQMELHFSRMKSLMLILLGLLLSATSFVLAYEFHFDPQELPESHGRYAWLTPVLMSGHGWTGFIIFFAFAACVLCWSGLTAWRALSFQPAVKCDCGIFTFHPSYFARGAIPLNALDQLLYVQETPPRMFGLIPATDALKFMFSTPRDEHFGRRTIKVRSNIIKGGKSELGFFYKDIEKIAGNRAQYRA